MNITTYKYKFSKYHDENKINVNTYLNSFMIKIHNISINTTINIKK